ncbi:MAG: hypothetical protein ABI638_00530 [Ignavibacteriota bacterium]
MQSIFNGGLHILKAYDILGKELATLVDKYKPQENMNLDFTHSKLITTNI